MPFFYEMCSRAEPGIMIFLVLKRPAPAHTGRFKTRNIMMPGSTDTCIKKEKTSREGCFLMLLHS